MSALGSLVVKLALDHAEYTKGLDRNSQAALKFAKNAQSNFDKAGRVAKSYFKNIAFGAVGAVGSFVSATAAANKLFDAIDKQDSLAKLSQQTGLAVESLAGLDFAASQSGTSLDRTAKGIRAFSRVIADSSGTMNKNVQILQAMGIEMDDLRDKTPEEQFLHFADAVEELGEKDRAVAVTALLGDRMAELVPLLSGGSERLRDLIDEGIRYNPVTAESALQAETFNDNLDKLGRSANTLFVGLTNDLVPSINEVTKSMILASKNGGILTTVWAGFISSVREFSKAHLGVEFFSDFQSELKAAEEAKKAVKDMTGSVDELEKKTKKASKQGMTFAEILALIDKRFKKTSASSKSFTGSLDDEEREVEELERDIRRLTLAYDPLIDRNEQLAKLMQLRDAGLRPDIVESESIRIIDEYIKKTTDVGDSIDEIERKTQRYGDTTRQVFDTNTEIAIQGVRSIQNALADGLFNFADDRFKGMVRSAKNAFLRIAAEFASIKWLQASGIAGLIGTGSSSAFAGGGGASAFDIANTGIGAANLVNSGFGASSLFGSFATSGLGQSLGLSVTGPVANFGQLTSLGSGLSSGLGVLGAGGVGIGIGSLLAGNKEIAGLNGTITSGAGAATGAAIGSVFPGIGTAIGALAGGIIGGAVNAIFGRGAPKFKQEELVGSVSAGGFEGVLNQQFKEKGGLALSSRFSNFIADTDNGVLLNEFGRLSESGNIPGGLRDAVTDSAIERALEVGSFLDEAFGAIDNTLRDTADILGIGTSALDSFNAQIDLISEKGEALTEQQISGAIADISNQMIATLIPSIDELARGGESYANTLTRIGAEFNALENVLVVTGQSVDQAREKIQGLTFAERTGLTDRFGGADALNAQVNSFFNNVLDESQKLDIVEARVLDALKPIGVDFIPTIDQLYDAFASGNPDLVQAALHYDELIIEANRLNESVNGVTGSVQSLTDSLDEARKKAVALGETERQGIKDRADRAKGAFEFFRNISFTDEQKIAFEADQFANAVSRIDGVDYSSFGALVGSVNDMIASNNGDFLDVIDAMKQFPLFIKSLKESGLDDPISPISQPDAKNLTRNLEAELRDAFSNLERVANAEKNKISNHFQAMFDSIDDSISNTTSKISDLQSISSLLTRTVDEIKGISINEARAQISGAITRARFGGQLDVDKLGASLSVLKNQDSESFATRFDFARSQSANIGLVDSLNAAVGDQLSIEEQALDSLENQRKLIQEQYDFEIETLTSMLDAARDQVEQMLGIDMTLNTLLGAKGNLYNALIAIAKNTDKTAKLLTLAGSFASGGTHGGGLRFVGERGIELEATGPSRIFSNSEVKQMMGGGSVVVDTRRMESLLNNVSEQMGTVAEQTKKTADFLRNVTRDGQSIVTTPA